MEDYIVIVSTISLASLILALLWMLKRGEPQAQLQYISNAQTYREIPTADADAGQTSVQDESAENLDPGEEDEEEESFETCSGGDAIPLGVEAVQEDVVKKEEGEQERDNAADNSDLDIDQVLQELENEVNLRLAEEESRGSAAVGGEEEESEETKNLVSTNDIKQIASSSLGSSSGKSRRDELEESGIFDLDADPDTLEASGQFNTFNQPDSGAVDREENICSENYDVDESCNEPETVQSSSQVDETPNISDYDNAAEPLPADGTTLDGDSIPVIVTQENIQEIKTEADVISPINCDQVCEKDASLEGKQTEDEMAASISQAQSFLPDLIQETIVNNVSALPQPIEQPLPSPIELSNTCSTPDQSDKSRSNGSIGSPDKCPCDSSKIDGCDIEGEIIYDLDLVPAEEHGIQHALDEIDNERYRQVFSCAIDVYSRETTPDSDAAEEEHSILTSPVAETIQDSLDKTSNIQSYDSAQQDDTQDPQWPRAPTPVQEPLNTQEVPASDPSPSIQEPVKDVCYPGEGQQDVHELKTVGTVVQPNNRMDEQIPETVDAGEAAPDPHVKDHAEIQDDLLKQNLSDTVESMSVSSEITFNEDALIITPQENQKDKEDIQKDMIPVEELRGKEEVIVKTQVGNEAQSVAGEAENVSEEISFNNSGISETVVLTPEPLNESVGENESTATEKYVLNDSTEKLNLKDADSNISEKIPSHEEPPINVEPLVIPVKYEVPDDEIPADFPVEDTVDDIYDLFSTMGQQEKVSFIHELIWRSVHFHDLETLPSREEHPELYKLIEEQLADLKYAEVSPDLDSIKPDETPENVAIETKTREDGIKEELPDIEQTFDNSGTTFSSLPHIHRVEKVLRLQHPSSPDKAAEVRLQAGDAMVDQSSLTDEERKIEEEVKEEDDKSTVLAKQKTFNENCCMRCFSRFFFIFNQKVQCFGCKFYVCKNCSDYDKEEKEYVCKVCQKQRELQNQSCDWFYSNVKKKFKRFGSAKVVRSLYKRKTESDSENDSGYHPALYNSEPIGKRSRQSLGGLFDIDISGGDSNQREPHASDTAPGGKLQHDDSDTSLVEEEIIAERREKKYSTPYSCAVATGQDSFSHVYDAELKDFKKQVESIITDIHRTLDVQSPDIVSKDDNNGENFDKTVTNHKLHLSSALTNLAQSLHIAVDNQDPQTVPSTPVSATAKHQLVKQSLVREVENFTGHPIDIGEEPTSEYASEDGSQTSDSQSQRPYEDILADFMLKKIVEDFQIAQDEIDRREEAALERSLKRLENCANVTLLNDMLSGVSESETDDHMSSAQTSRLDETVSDVESKVSDFSELSLTTKDIGDSPITDMSSPQLYTRKSGATGGKGLDINENRTVSNSSSGDMDNLTNDERNRRVDEDSLDEDRLWGTVESKMSPMVSFAPQFSRKTYIDPENPEEGFARFYSTPVKIPGEDSPMDVASPDASREDMDSDNTLEGSPPEESLIEAAAREQNSAEGPDDESMLDYTENRRVPLPSFDGDSVAGLPEVDLDDISRRGDDEEEPRSPNWESEITFSAQWKFDSGGLFNDRRISAYDNYGEKKVGLDGDGPVIMLVPKTGEDGESIRVGDRDIDEVSELSENDAPSDISLDPSDDEELAEAAQKVTKEISTMTESVQTEEEEAVAAEAVSAVKAETAPSELPPVSSEADETDPKFVKRPANISILEGEPMKLECEVEGTGPIDVFWYKDTAEVAPLEEDERSEVTIQDNKHVVEVYNTTKADAGQYLCIGVNDQGQCNQSFKVAVGENTNEKAAPEFIKGLQDIEVIVGQSVKFRCKVKGYPIPRVLWYRDGKRIKNSDQYRIEKYGNRDYVLWLEYASISDDAEYMVVARNMIGEAKSKAQLIVEATEEALQERTDKAEGPVSPEIPDTTRVSDALYPDTDELLRLAEQVSATRGNVQETSKKTASSARQFNSLNQQLDEMDRRLETLQDEVVDTMNNNSGESWSAQRPVNDDLQSSAYAVREVTNSALGVLAEAEVARDNNTSQVQLVLTKADEAPEDEEVDINLTFVEFEKLYAAGKITREQMKTGRVNRKDKKMIEDYLRQEAQYERQNDLDRSHELVVDDDGLKVFDCGLKRVDSKRYKRDYVVNKDANKSSPQVPRRKSWVVQPTPAPAKTVPQNVEVVKSTPAGQRENVHAEIARAEEQEPLYDIQEQDEAITGGPINDEPASEQEKEIYMAAGKVYDLETQVQELERQVESINENSSPWDLSRLEDKVANAVADVSSYEDEVTEIEKTLGQTFADAPNMPSEWKMALKFSRRHSEIDNPPQINNYIDRRQSMPVFSSSTPASRQASMALPPSVSEFVQPEPREESFSPVPRPEPQHRNIQGPEPSDDVFEDNVSPVPAVYTPPPRKESVQLSGETDEEAVPESRTETDDDIHLPSVKNLRSMFNQPGKEDSSDSSVKRHPQSYSARVYSLTGRDIPRTIREKLKKQGPSIVPNTNVRSSEPQYEIQRRPIGSIFEDPNTQAVESHQASSLQSSPSSVDEVYPHAVTEQPLNTSVQELSSGGATRSTNPVRRSQSFDVSSGMKPTYTKPQSKEEPLRRPSLGAPKKGRNSTIMARAAFWDTRINMGSVTDESVDLEFPEMPDDSFKAEPEDN